MADMQSQLLAVKDQMQNPSQQQQARGGSPRQPQGGAPAGDPSKKADKKKPGGQGDGSFKVGQPDRDPKKVGREVQPKRPEERMPGFDVRKFEMLIDQLSEICSDTEYILETLEENLPEEASTEDKTAFENKSGPLKTKIGEIKTAVLSAGVEGERFARRDLKAVVRSILLLTSKYDVPSDTELGKAVQKIENFVKEAPPYAKTGEPLVLENTPAAGVLRPQINTTNELPRSHELKHNNPPIGKLISAIYTKHSLPDLLAWHKEYILDGGLDTFRENNTHNKLSAQEIIAIKEFLQYTLEDIQRLEDNITSAADSETLRSRKSDYAIYAEVLSGNPKPDSPTEYLTQHLSVQEIDKDIRRIGREPSHAITIPDDVTAEDLSLIEKLIGEGKDVTPELLVQESGGKTTKEKAEKIINALS